MVTEVSVLRDGREMRIPVERAPATTGRSGYGVCDSKGCPATGPAAKLSGKAYPRAITDLVAV